MIEFKFNPVDLKECRTMDEEVTRVICESLGIPKRCFVGDRNTDSAANDAQLRDRLNRCREWFVDRVIEPLAGECWYQVSRVNHVSVGQEKRDFFRALAKLNGIKQVNVLPKVVWND